MAIVRWFRGIRAWFTARILKRLFLTAPETKTNANKARVFDELLRYAIELGPDVNLNYVCAYPKHEFLTYLAQHHHLVLHGTNDTNLDKLEPEKLYKEDGYPNHILFASQDGIEPIFHAVLDHQQAQDARHDCFVVKNTHTEERYYYFSLSDTMGAPNWKKGTVYILLQGAFTPEQENWLQDASWKAGKSIYPLTRLSVTPEDFPFRDGVVHHKAGESNLKSWVQYRQRLRN